MQANVYLNYRGRTEEAIEHYVTAIGAKRGQLMRHEEQPDLSKTGVGDHGKIMHASFFIGKTEIMATDGDDSQPDANAFDGFALTLATKDKEETDRIFHALSEGGRVIEPLQETSFSPRFGIVEDKFGLRWMPMQEHK